jgi:hypothetical protein
LRSGAVWHNGEPTSDDCVVSHADHRAARTDSLAAQKALAKDHKLLLPYPRVAPATRGEGDGIEQTQVVYNPPQTAPGLGPPRTWNGAWIQICLPKMPMNDQQRMIPAATLSGGGQMEQGRPGKGASLYCPCLTP